MELDILYEDGALIAVDKPAGIVAHPTYRNVAGTLLDALRAYGSSWADDAHPTIVGRLDKGTSGVVIAAKSAPIHAALQRILSSPDAEKQYLAVVCGVVDADSGAIALPLRIDPSDRRRVIVCDADSGAQCETRFERLETVGQLSLLRCHLITGRRHQIRVHLAASGWPVVGDGVYGRGLDGFPRHALHAWRTSLTHPLSGERLTIEAPIPAEMRNLLPASRWMASR